MADLTQKFWNKVNIGNPDQCWNWTGAVTLGYGYMVFQGKNERAHRIAYMLGHGKAIQDCILHLCDNKLCCNPKHLMDGTRKENAEHFRQALDRY